MILPGKHLSPDRAIIGVGAEILAHLDRPQDASELWDHVRAARGSARSRAPLSFDWFVLALTFLFTIQAVDLEDGLIKSRQATP